MGGGGIRWHAKRAAVLGHGHPTPGIFEIRYSEVNSAGFWGWLFSFFILNIRVKGVKIRFVGFLYFSICTSQQNMCTLYFDLCFSEVYLRLRNS